MKELLYCHDIVIEIIRCILYFQSLLCFKRKNKNIYGKY